MCSIGCKRTYTMRTCVYGTKGTIIFNSSFIELYKEHFSDDPIFEGKDQMKIKLPFPTGHNDHNTTGEITDFCNAIRDGKLVSRTGVEGAITTYACMAIVESARTGEKVVMDYDFL